MSADDSGPAFPVNPIPSQDVYTISHPGMSMRDFFAAAALVGFAVRGETSTDVAGWAYELADAMIKERVRS